MRDIKRERHGTSSAWLCAAILLYSASCGGCRSRTPEPDYSLLLAAWQKSDGEGTFVMADSLFDAMLVNPDKFFSTMKADRPGFERFVDDLQSTVFTNFNDTITAVLEQKRTDAIKLLERTHVQPEHTDMLQSVMKALKELRPRFVD
jgi:hypothetical protein